MSGRCAPTRRRSGPALAPGSGLPYNAGMKRRYDSLARLLATPGQIIDVRSPAEYALDHVPGAVNLPVLSDAERAHVGTVYTQDSPFKARKIGAALVSRNAARHLEGPLADKPGDWQALVYCWRGGQRSGSFATILGQVGWRVGVLDGGYRSYRRLVRAALNDAPILAPVVVIDGLTGTAKTDVLGCLAARGVQVIDLEGLARHRGSILGARPGGQPSQKAFESALAAQVAALDPARPVLVEAESQRIGALHLPQQLWRAMCAAPAITLSAPVRARAEYLAGAYADVIAEGGAVRDGLDKLRHLRGGDAHAHWTALLDAGDHTELAQALIQDHYDAAYAKAAALRPRESLAVLESARLAPADHDRLAAEVQQVLSSAGLGRG